VVSVHGGFGLPGNGTEQTLDFWFPFLTRRLQKRREGQSGELLAVAGMLTAGVWTPTPGSLSQRTTPVELHGWVAVPAAGWDQVSNPGPVARGFYFLVRFFRKVLGEW